MNSDVFFGGGAEQFKPGSGSPNRTNYYDAFAAKGYQIVNDNTALQAADASKRTLGIFSQSNMAKYVQSASLIMDRWLTFPIAGGSTEMFTLRT